MNLEFQVNKVVSVAWYHLRSIFLTLEYLTQSATEAIVHAFISFKLDLNNALLFGISACLIKKLQTVQNSAAGVVVCTDRYARVKPILKKLHWLPLQQRINFKIILLTFKALHGLTAPYISELKPIKIVSRELRNYKSLLLMEDTLNSTFGEIVFSVASPIVWNKLPFAIRNIDNLNRFKKELKSHLFQFW